MPSVSARTTVRGPDAKHLIQLLGYTLTTLAVIAVVAAGAWLGLPGPLIAVMVVIEVAFGIAVTMRQ